MLWLCVLGLRRCSMPTGAACLPAPAPPARSVATSDEHKLAYEQFRGVAVWRKGMDVRVPLTALLEAAPPK